jgi:hypothetical protein
VHAGRFALLPCVRVLVAKGFLGLCRAPARQLRQIVRLEVVQGSGPILLRFHRLRTRAPGVSPISPRLGLSSLRQRPRSCRRYGKRAVTITLGLAVLVFPGVLGPCALARSVFPSAFLRESRVIQDRNTSDTAGLSRRELAVGAVCLSPAGPQVLVPTRYFEDSRLP